MDRKLNEELRVFLDAESRLQDFHTQHARLMAEYRELVETYNATCTAVRNRLKGIEFQDERFKLDRFTASKRYKTFYMPEVFQLRYPDSLTVEGIIKTLDTAKLEEAALAGRIPAQALVDAKVTRLETVAVTGPNVIEIG